MEIEPSKEVIFRTEKPNSYEFGRAGDRFKIFFNTPEDLRNQLNELIAMGFNIELTFNPMKGGECEDE